MHARNWWLLLSVVVSCDSDGARCDAPLEVSEGFCAAVFAEDVERARHIAVSPSGIVYVGTWTEGSRAGGVVALQDTNRDGRADVREQFGSEGGSGLAISDGYLFHGAWDRVYRWKLPLSGLLPTEAPHVVVKDIPELEHGARTITIGNDGTLYVNIGVPSNACERNYPARDFGGDNPCGELAYSGGIWRFPLALSSDSARSPSPDYRFATGLRHTVALAIDPITGKLYGAPHGIDHLNSWWPDAGYSKEDAASKPPETLFEIWPNGDYAFPYCMFDVAANQMIVTPAYRRFAAEYNDRCRNAPRPIALFPAHSAPLAITFYDKDDFGSKYHNGMFVALHGSLFRAPLRPVGYSVVFLPRLPNGGFGKPETFADAMGSRVRLSRRARPSGLAVGPEGELYVADDAGGRVIKIVTEHRDGKP